MALTKSNMLPLGFKAPNFSLPNVVNRNFESLEVLKGHRGTLVVFMCNHCPYVIHLLDEFVSLAAEYKTKGINTIAISSNNVNTHPADSPDKMKKLALKKNFSFPYLYDQSQEVAKSYDATCTPDFFLFDQEINLVYRGCFDQSRPGNNTPITGNHLRNAIDLLLLGEPISEEQFPSMGCNIKWI